MQIRPGNLLSIVFLCSAGLSFADTINFDVNYTGAGNDCTSSQGSPFSCTAVTESFIGTFSLTSAQLGTDGSWDVSSSLNITAPFDGQPLSISPGSTLGGVPDPATATAITSAGLVTDLVVSFSPVFSQSGPVSIFLSYNLNAKDNAYTIADDSRTSVSFPSGGVEGEETRNTSGTYTISEVITTPEPASIVLFLSGLISAAAFGAFKRQAAGR